MRRPDKAPAAKGDTTEKVVFINRCAKVVKGGRRFSFSALIVAGDHDGKVGCGFGKANEVSEAIRKASEAARKSMEKVSLNENTIPHEVIGEYDGARVLLRPASPLLRWHDCSTQATWPAHRECRLLRLRPAHLRQQ